MYENYKMRGYKGRTGLVVKEHRLLKSLNKTVLYCDANQTFCFNTIFINSSVVHLSHDIFMLINNKKTEVI